MSAAKDMRKLMDEFAAEMGEEVSKFTPDGRQKLIEIDTAISESIQLTEASVYEESKFIAIMTWFMAESGMPGKHDAADMLKEKYPEATPWEWRSGFKVYLNAQKGRE